LILYPPTEIAAMSSDIDAPEPTRMSEGLKMSSSDIAKYPPDVPYGHNVEDERWCCCRATAVLCRGNRRRMLQDEEKTIGYAVRLLLKNPLKNEYCKVRAALIRFDSSFRFRNDIKSALALRHQTPFVYTDGYLTVPM
jgi:hypothetical protein